MMDDSALRERYLSVLDRLGEAIARAGRKPEEVRLIAVSKLHPAEDVACVAAAGQVDFGENYVQEALQKRQDLVAQPQCRDIRWHMIGHVQSRKAAQVAGAFALVHTLDSVKLADALEKRAAALGVVQPVLCEINVGEEPQKAGIMADALPELEEHVLARCPHLEMQGLMCLPPVFDAGEAARPYFARLYRLREDMRARTGLPLPSIQGGSPHFGFKDTAFFIEKDTSGDSCDIVFLGDRSVKTVGITQLLPNHFFFFQNQRS